jgi:hypothetical protein
MVVLHLASVMIILHALWEARSRPIVPLAGVDAPCVVRPDVVDVRWCERFARRWLLLRHRAGDDPGGRRYQECVRACSGPCADAIVPLLHQDAEDAKSLAKATLVYACTIHSSSSQPGSWRVDYALTMQSFYGPLAARAERMTGHLTIVQRSVSLGDTEVLAVDGDCVEAREEL